MSCYVFSIGRKDKTRNEGQRGTSKKDGGHYPWFRHEDERERPEKQKLTRQGNLDGVSYVLIINRVFSCLNSRDYFPVTCSFHFAD